MFIEADGIIVDGVYDNRPACDGGGGIDHPLKGVFQQRGTQPFAVFAYVNCQPGEQDNGYVRMSRNSLEDSWNGGLSFDAARAKGVITDDAVIDVNDVGLRHAGALIHARITPKPVRQGRFPAVELIQGVMAGKGFGADNQPASRSAGLASWWTVSSEPCCSNTLGSLSKRRIRGRSLGGASSA